MNCTNEPCPLETKIARSITQLKMQIKISTPILGSLETRLKEDSVRINTVLIIGVKIQQLCPRICGN